MSRGVTCVASFFLIIICLLLLFPPHPRQRKKPTKLTTASLPTATDTKASLSVASYSTQSPTQHNTPTPLQTPFTPLVNAEAEAILKQCSAPSNYSGRPMQQRDYSFAGFIASDHGDGAVKLHCTAILITLRHGITSRQCIVAARNASSESTQWKLAVGESCWRTSTATNASQCPLLAIDLIAFYSNISTARRDLAVIQLKRPIDEELIIRMDKETIQDKDGHLAIKVKPQADSLYPQPGPSNETIEVHLEEDKPTQSPESRPGLHPFSNKYCDEEKLICMPDYSKEGQSNGGMEPGWGLHDRLGDGKLVGLFVDQLDKKVEFEDTEVRVNAYMDAHQYLADFCVYLNLCYTANKTYDELVIPDFNRTLQV